MEITITIPDGAEQDIKDALGDNPGRRALELIAALAYRNGAISRPALGRLLRLENIWQEKAFIQRENAVRPLSPEEAQHDVDYALKRAAEIRAEKSQES